MPASRSVHVPRVGRRPAAARGVLYPLDALYARAGMVSPVVKPVTAGRIPSLCRELLVHQNGMTSALEHHYDGPVTVRVLSSFMRGQSYFRRVLLVMEETGQPVAMGAVRLTFEYFNKRVRARILSEQVPLGHILREAGLPYHSRPTAFFEVTPTAEMLGFFWMSQPRAFYGRQTAVTVRGARLGDIVEILPLV